MGFWIFTLLLMFGVSAFMVYRFRVRGGARARVRAMLSVRGRVSAFIVYPINFNPNPPTITLIPTYTITLTLALTPALTLTLNLTLTLTLTLTVTNPER